MPELKIDTTVGSSHFIIALEPSCLRLSSLPLYIRVKISPETGYLDSDFKWFYSFPLGKVQDSTSSYAVTLSFHVLSNSSLPFDATHRQVQ